MNFKKKYIRPHSTNSDYWHYDAKAWESGLTEREKFLIRKIRIERANYRLRMRVPHLFKKYQYYRSRFGSSTRSRMPIRRYLLPLYPHNDYEGAVRVLTKKLILPCYHGRPGRGAVLFFLYRWPQPRFAMHALELLHPAKFDDPAPVCYCPRSLLRLESRVWNWVDRRPGSRGVIGGGSLHYSHVFARREYDRELL